MICDAVKRYNLI